VWRCVSSQSMTFLLLFVMGRSLGLVFTSLKTATSKSNENALVIPHFSVLTRIVFHSRRSRKFFSRIEYLQHFSLLFQSEKSKKDAFPEKCPGT
jgi:hypothetical protein